MCEQSHRRWGVGTGAVILGLGLASMAMAGQGVSADGTHHARRLGGSTSFYAPPLKSAASLKQLAAKKGMSDDIRAVLTESGIPETADAVLATIAGTTSSVAGAFCAEATPADGIVVACEVQPGSTLLWMAYRPDARKGIRTPHRLERVRWAGNKPFKALLFRVTNDYKIYSFVLPLACSNLSLMSVTEIPGEPVDVSVDRTCDPKTGIMRATIKASSKDLQRVSRVRVALNGQSVGELTGPSWTFIASKPGEYTFDAVDAKGRSYPMARRTLRIDACPPPPVEIKPVVAPTCSVTLTMSPARRAWDLSIDATRSSTGTSGVVPVVTVEVRDEAGVVVGQKLTLDNSLTGKITVRRYGTYLATATVITPDGVEVGGSRYAGTTTCEASLTIEKPANNMSIFFDVLGGKDRRVRPIENTNLEFGQCSPLLGVKFGVGHRFGNNWEVAGAAGLAISLVTDDQKVKEHEFFIDAEVNKHLASGAFIGTGISFWDLTRSDTWTPAWLLHFGLPLSKHANHTVYFIAEGRMFLDHADDIKNNYQFWGGVRVNFNRR